MNISDDYDVEYKELLKEEYSNNSGETVEAYIKNIEHVIRKFQSGDIISDIVLDLKKEVDENFFITRKYFTRLSSVYEKLNISDRAFFNFLKEKYKVLEDEYENIDFDKLIKYTQEND